MKIKAKLNGGASLTKLLARTLPDTATRKANGRAVTVSSTIVLKEMKKTAPQESGTLVLSLGKKIKRYKSGAAVAVVGARRSVSSEYRGQTRIPANYAHNVEAGHGGPKPAEPRPFAAPAYRNVEAKALAKSREAYEQSIIKSARGS